MRAYDAALDCTAELARSCPSDREHNTIAESAYRQVFLADGVPDYLRGLSRAELHARIADYCDAHYRGYVEEREERDRRALELLEVDGWLLTDAEDYGADYPTPEVLL